MSTKLQQKKQRLAEKLRAHEERLKVEKAKLDEAEKELTAEIDNEIVIVMRKGIKDGATAESLFYAVKGLLR